MSTTDYDTTTFINELRNVYGTDNINAMIDGRRYFMWLNNMDYTENMFKNRILYSNSGNWNNIQHRERILRSEAIQIRHLLQGRNRFTRDIRGYYEYYADEEQEIENIIENLTRYIESYTEDNNNDTNNDTNNNISG